MVISTHGALRRLTAIPMLRIIVEHNGHSVVVDAVRVIRQGDAERVRQHS